MERKVNEKVLESIKNRVKGDVSLSVKTLSGFMSADDLRSFVVDLLDSVIDGYSETSDPSVNAKNYD